jgi:glyoxylase-like metal-dependent hydrolase (beta-lactamase superfamily II)/8-oxo-dGTP pyrophosphatase MutT (NUDIX family)
LRDGEAGLEVLMLRRADREGDLRSGAAVFPGGVLDPRDHQAYAHCRGPDDVQASALLGVAAGGLDYWVAAVRETFEEVGLLLCQGQPDLAALQPWRDRLNRGQASIAEMCSAHGLTLDLQGLTYFSHWLTPPGAPKRFDTRFFIAMAPALQEAQADMGEAVELMWLTPKAALDPQRGLKLLPVTQQTLLELSRSSTAAQALAAAQARKEVRLTMPRRAVTARGPRVVLPHELPYAEVGRLDPLGQGDTFCDLLPARAVRLSPRILRVTAPNPGPMTGPGTNSYLVSAPTAGPDEPRQWTVIDPGPESAPHLQALLAAAQPGRIVQILVTHTHRDHSPGALALAQATGAPVLGRTATHPEWQDTSFAPQRELQHQERLHLGDGATLRVLHTPGHASNHLCYLLEEESLLFTGDHVMQGSTVVINPPDGDMVAYLAALQALLSEPLQWLAPGHGFLVDRPHEVLRGLLAHRLKRHQKVSDALAQRGQASLDDLLPAVYDDVPAALHGVAKRSLLAHVLKLQHEGQAVFDEGSTRWRWV